jgi:hypothetical protein
MMMMLMMMIWWWWRWKWRLQSVHEPKQITKKNYIKNVLHAWMRE